MFIVKERTDELMSMLNGNTVSTLTFNQLHGGNGAQPSRDGTQVGGRGRATAQSMTGSS